MTDLERAAAAWDAFVAEVKAQRFDFLILAGGFYLLALAYAAWQIWMVA